MKQLLILLTAFSLFATACNNDKTASRDRETKSTKNGDDYRDNKDEDSKSSDKDENKDENKSNSDDDNSSRDSGKGWSAMEINTFVTNCVNSASDGGMARSAAQKYCDCMQEKLEKIYPNANDAAGLDLESESTKKMIQDCLN